jgi:hypothetical protein
MVSDEQTPEPVLFRVDIARDWSVRDLTEFMSAVQFLYDLRLVLSVASRDIPNFYRKPEAGPWSLWPTRPWPLTLPSEVSEIVLPRERLRIRRLRYASKGAIDFAGVGEVATAVTDFLSHAIDVYVTRDQRRHENERRRLENEALKVENEAASEQRRLENDRRRSENEIETQKERQRLTLAEEYVAVAKDLGLPQVEQRQIVAAVLERQDAIGRLVRDGRVTEVRALRAEDEST